MGIWEHEENEEKHERQASVLYIFSSVLKCLHETELLKCFYETERRIQ